MGRRIEEDGGGWRGRMDFMFFLFLFSPSSLLYACSPFPLFLSSPYLFTWPWIKCDKYLPTF
jgi:hypothetical protein